MSPQVPRDVPYSRGPNVFGKLPGDTLAQDYLGVRSFGGGSNHYNYGVGLYGFHWYFNTSGTVGTLKLGRNGEDPNSGRAFEQVWPDLPSEITMTLGWGINSVMIPSMGMVQVCAGDANWDHPYLAPRGPDAFNYRMIELLVESLSDSMKDETRKGISPVAR
jgi:hypothetical protein